MRVLSGVLSRIVHGKETPHIVSRPTATCRGLMGAQPLHERKYAYFYLKLRGQSCPLRDGLLRIQLMGYVGSANAVMGDAPAVKVSR